MNHQLRIDDFDYHLPAELIAQRPAMERDSSRLMVLSRQLDHISHQVFSDLPNFLLDGDLLVMNDVKVIPARIRGHRKTGGQVEVFILDGWKQKPDRFLLSPARRITPGEILKLQNDWSLTILSRENGVFMGQIEGPGQFQDFLASFGEMPTPPYIRRKGNMIERDLDRMRYQTIFANNSGAVAAPTAGLHFTHHLMARLKQKGIAICYVTLWVGWGTFRPVKNELVSEHVMESEHYRILPETARLIEQAKADGRRIVAVGTTTTRALESWGRQYPDCRAVDFSETDIFITPGFEFKIINALITNFHLPKSTLIMLVSAFLGREKLLHAYQIAIDNHYRFYSYGDAMLIE